MTSAKLLVAVEPVIRYQRTPLPRRRAGDARLAALRARPAAAARTCCTGWSTSGRPARPAPSLGFATARLFDELDPIEKAKTSILAETGHHGARRAQALQGSEPARGRAREARAKPEGERDAARIAELESDPLVRYAVLDSAGNVLCPAAKLWNTGHGATMMREAVSLMGGYGITEDCPGFLGHKWMDAQLEATYEGPEAVQRRQLSHHDDERGVPRPVQQWIARCATIASERPGTGACALAHGDAAVALDAASTCSVATDADGAKLYQGPRQGVTFPLADALCWLLAARRSILDVLELEREGRREPDRRRGLPGLVAVLQDLATCSARAPRAKSAASAPSSCTATTATRRGTTTARKACCTANELDELEGLIPGIGELRDRRHRGRRLAPGEGRPVREVRGLAGLRGAAREGGRLPHRLAAREGPRAPKRSRR